MDLSKEQIKKILDEAPEGATDWWQLLCGDYIGFYGTYDEDISFLRDMWNRIPLSGLRKQLGEAEWKNGLPPIGVECWFNFKVTHSQKCTPKYFGSDIVVYTNDKGREYSLLLSEVSFSKIEAEAERVERERLEIESEIEDIISGMINLIGIGAKDIARAIVDKAIYRKQAE